MYLLPTLYSLLTDIRLSRILIIWVSHNRLEALDDNEKHNPRWSLSSMSKYMQGKDYLGWKIDDNNHSFS